MPLSNIDVVYLSNDESYKLQKGIGFLTWLDAVVNFMNPWQQLTGLTHNEYLCRHVVNGLLDLASVLSFSYLLAEEVKISGSFE